MESKFFKKEEYQGLQKLYSLSPRNPNQSNKFNNADAELIKLGPSQYIVTSTDTIAIEIHSNLYRNPETWGYLSIANSVSDLAATGAKPIGMLISAQWKNSHNIKIKNRVYQSMAKALQAFQIPLLGGDSGSSHQTVLTTTIIGQSKTPPLNRLGIVPGDLILIFGKEFGWGPALAFDFIRFKSTSHLEYKFRPQPSWQTTYKFKRYFKSSIDTSDGIFNALTVLGDLNNVDFLVNTSNLRLSKRIENYRIKFGIPIEYFIESDLGDLQLCIAIDSKKYSTIKSRLPYHQVLAKTLEPKGLKLNVHYSNSKTENLTFYKSLSQVLEKNKMNYASSLKNWMDQF